MTTTLNISPSILDAVLDEDDYHPPPLESPAHLSVEVLTESLNANLRYQNALREHMVALQRRLNTVATHRAFLERTPFTQSPGIEMRMACSGVQQLPDFISDTGEVFLALHLARWIWY